METDQVSLMEGVAAHAWEAHDQERLEEIMADNSRRAILVWSGSAQGFHQKLAETIADMTTVFDGREKIDRFKSLLKAIGKRKTFEADPQTGKARKDRLILTGPQVFGAHEFIEGLVDSSDQASSLNEVNKRVRSFGQELVGKYPTAPVVESQPVGLKQWIGGMIPRGGK